MLATLTAEASDWPAPSQGTAAPSIEARRGAYQEKPSSVVKYDSTLSRSIRERDKDSNAKG